MESGIEEEGWGEIVDYYYPSLQDEQQSRLGWVMDAGKKIVITGVVVSSIPLFLPPLVVISALGLALSVPFGVVFASYACTQKLMTKLLPSPAHPATPDIKEMDNQYDDGYSRDEIMREEPEVEIDDDDDVGNGNGGVDDEQQQQQEKGRSLDEQGDDPYFNVVKTVDDVKQGENLLPEKIIIETKTEDLPQEKNENIIIEANNDEGEENGAVDEIIVTETKKDEGEKMKKETGKRRKKKKDLGKRKEAEGEGENVESGKVIVVEEGTTLADKIEVSSVVTQDDSGVTVLETTTIIADGKGTELKEEKHITGLPSENQEAFQDDKIWEKIDAIRGITGFKAPRRDSYYEELKALYLFTGIEAPATSPDTPAADFVEFYSKLCFLMSVIGVK